MEVADESLPVVRASGGPLKPA